MVVLECYKLKRLPKTQSNGSSFFRFPVCPAGVCDKPLWTLPVSHVRGVIMFLGSTNTYLTTYRLFKSPLNQSLISSRCCTNQVTNHVTPLPLKRALLFRRLPYFITRKDDRKLLEAFLSQNDGNYHWFPMNSMSRSLK